MMDASETSAGEQLLRSDEVARLAVVIAGDVRLHVQSVMQGPFGIAGAQAIATPFNPNPSPPDVSTLRSPGIGGSPGNFGPDPTGGLNGGVPQRFIAAGVALTVAYTALGEADGARVAGALRCASEILFPDDPSGFAQVERAAGVAVRPLEPIEAPMIADAVRATEAMQHRVFAAAQSLDRAFQASMDHLTTASLDAHSWRQVTGGLGPSSGLITTAFGPFLPGLVRWAFYTAVALRFIRMDDWAWVGACLIGARTDVQRGADGMNVVPPVM
ncbi:MAG: hypothetical protein DWI69_13845 [Chloroflexi bacterium]|nr:MAG: hypothetical protein DWI69_13845 [Chloroflexota bacterium]